MKLTSGSFRPGCASFESHDLSSMGGWRSSSIAWATAGIYSVLHSRLEAPILSGSKCPFAPGSRAIIDQRLGPAQQAADILTRAHTTEPIRQLASGPGELVDLVAAMAGKP